MKTRIQKLGDGLALLIPPTLVAGSGLTEDTVVDVSLVEGRLMVTPSDQSLTLEDLLSKITPENCHPEWDTGPAVGGEVW